MKLIPLNGNILLPSKRMRFSLKCYFNIYTSDETEREYEQMNTDYKYSNFSENSWFKILYIVLIGFIFGVTDARKRSWKRRNIKSSFDW